jgi:ABC-type lipoprotein export system ATPase subunit
VTEAVVHLRDVFRVYSTPEGDAAALQGLSARVENGEIVAVLGPSGSGKTTLLRILAALEPPSAGHVRVLGLDLPRLPAGRRAAYRAELVGYADQHYGRALAGELRAREAVALQATLRGSPRRAALARADALLERVGLFARRDARPAELSGGEQQRIAVCAALAHRPRLLLADEPTGELDAANAALVFALVRDLAREAGSTAVVVSHDPAAAGIADRILHVRDGRVSAESTLVAGGDGGGIVVGRGGWLRLPEELLRRAGIGTRARARVVEGGVLVTAEPKASVRESGPVEGVPGEPRGSPGEREPLAGKPVAEVRGLRRTYGATVALTGVSTDFRAGALTAVTGPSGSGKTTLLRLLAGLDLPSDGSVTVLGSELPALDRAERARFRRAHVAVVDQQVSLVPFLSARENVELALALRGARANHERALEALAAVGLEERAEQRVSRLSTGERARVAVARALACEPALLLADEPTSRLDAAYALAVAALLARLARERGTAVVCATHDPLLIEQADDELSLRGAR